MREIVELFKNGNVMVCGMMGSGKDVLFGNVIMRMKRPYVSNQDYGGDRIKFEPRMLDFNNDWKNFITGKLNHFEYPLPDRVHIWLSDGGVYLPAQYHTEITREYPYLGTSFPLMRQVAGSWLHINVQDPARIYLHLREQSDTYIRCIKCFVLFGKIVIQRLIVYERYQSCCDRVPVFPLRRPSFNKDRIQQYEIQKMNYEIAHGKVEGKTLIYWNKSKHNTRGFKEMLANA